MILKPRGAGREPRRGEGRTRPRSSRGNWAFAHDTTVPEAPHYDVKVLVEEFADGLRDQHRLGRVPGRGVAVLPGPQGDRLPAVRRGDRPLRRRGATRCCADEQLIAGAASTRTRRIGVHRRGHAHRDHDDGRRPEGDRDQRPDRRRHDPVPRPEGDRRRPRAGGGGGRLRAWSRTLVPDRTLVGGVRFFYVDENDTVLDSVEFDRSRACRRRIDQLVPLMEAGQTTSPPPDGTLWGRIAYATVGRRRRSRTAALGWTPPRRHCVGPGERSKGARGAEHDSRTEESTGVWATIRDAPVPVKALLVGVFVNKLGWFLQVFLVLFLTTSKGFTDVQAGTRARRVRRWFGHRPDHRRLAVGQGRAARRGDDQHVRHGRVRAGDRVRAELHRRAWSWSHWPVRSGSSTGRPRRRC